MARPTFRIRVIRSGAGLVERALTVPVEQPSVGQAKGYLGPSNEIEIESYLLS
jgi:hypothetical protein